RAVVFTFSLHDALPSWRYNTLDLSLSFISILALILSVAAISFAFFIYKARGRGEVLLTQPYLEIDEVREVVNDDGRKAIQFRVRSEEHQSELHSRLVLV